MIQLLAIKGKSQYDSTCIFFDEILDSFTSNDIIIDVLDSYDEDQYRNMRLSLQKKHYDAVLTMNGMILESDSSLGKLLLDNHTLYCTILMDHPCIHHSRLQNFHPHMMVYSPDLFHVEYLKNYYPHIKKADFLPHGGCMANKILPFRERNIDISFLGSYTAPEQIKGSFKKYPETMQVLFNETTDYLKINTQSTLENAVRTVFSAHDIQIPNESFASVLAEFRPVDAYIRAYFRDLVIRTITNAGITIDVYGDGWENFSTVCLHHLRIHPRIDFRESLNVTASSKIALNVMPWFKNGSHDRIFTAMLCETICLTDPSIWLKKECTDGKNIVFYSLEHLETLPDIIQKLLLNHKSLSTPAECLSKNGSYFAQLNHTWKNRGEKIYKDLLDAFRDFHS